MASEDVISDLRIMMGKFMAQEGVTNFDLKIEGKPEVGDNYMGEIIFFEAVPSNGSKTYKMVMKTAKRSEELKKLMPISLVYQRELFLYSTVFPAFSSLVKEMHSNCDTTFAPKLYWISTEEGKETLILENLKYQGFELWDRKKPWNLDHSLFVMKRYGEYHALSLAIRTQKPELFKEWKGHLRNLTEDFSKQFEPKKFYGEPFNAALDSLRKAGKEHLAEKYEKVFDDMLDAVKNAAPEEDQLVISHGDCWNNNFMFKYKGADTIKPNEMLFLDFQLSCLDTPVKDLSYNIYSVCDKTVLNDFNLLMTTYYSALLETFEKLGGDPNRLFTYETLMKHWRKYGSYGLLVSSVIIKFELLDRGKAPDLSKMSEEGKSLMDIFNLPIDDPSEYNRRVLDIFTHFGETFL